MKNALWLIVAFSVSGIPAATPPPVARDLSKYSTRGPYVLFYHHVSFYTDEDHALINSQMRQFFLDCWQKHQRGRLITIGFSIEGQPTRTTYFIEPDANGAWHVVIYTVVTLQKFNQEMAGPPPSPPPAITYYTEEHTTTATLETLKAADGKKRIRIISDGKALLDL